MSTIKLGKMGAKNIPRVPQDNYTSKAVKLEAFVETLRVEMKGFQAHRPGGANNSEGGVLREVGGPFSIHFACRVWDSPHVISHHG
jgi:hypothetical protein